jgi:FixJ family two-component response regulator
MREALAALIGSIGLGAMVFPSGQALLDDPACATIRCLISDVQMPGISGPELHRRLRAEGLSIPTILITAYPDELARHQALLDGVRCYLTKPLDEEHLLACIRSAVARAGG